MCRRFVAATPGREESRHVLPPVARADQKMPTYTAPGVYVEEVPSSQKVLSAAPTAVAAFVGFTATAPTDDPNDPQGLAPRLVTSWTQFESLYGGFSEGCVLPLSVYGYFAKDRKSVV